MDDQDKVICIRCFDACCYNLAYPQFFMTAPKATLRKIFKWLFQFRYYRANEVAIEFFDRALPELKGLIKTRSIETAEKVLSERMADYEREYRDPSMSKLPADWPQAKKKSERDRRKEFNKRYMERVKDAKAALKQAEKRFPKDLERAKEVCAIYQEAKNEYK